MVYIKDISELPSWFRIENYQIRKEDLSAESFLEQFFFRRMLFGLLTDPNLQIPYQIKANEYNEYTVHAFGSIPYILVDEIKLIKNRTIAPHTQEWDFKKQLILNAFEMIVKDPLLKNGYGKLITEQDFSLVYCLRHILTLYRQYEIKPITDISIYTIGEKYSLLSNEIKLYLNFEFKEFTENDCFSENLSDELKAKLNDEESITSWNYVDSLSEKDFMQLEVFCQKNFSEYECEIKEINPFYINPIIQVDLSSSDSIIQEQFSLWLKKQRKEYLEKNLDEQIDVGYTVKKNGESFLYKMNQYKVLAYLDLYLWSLLNDHKIKRSVYSHALYINGSYDSEFIRKNLIPQIQSLFDPSSSSIAELFSLKKMEELRG
ncbi:DUF6387 family protein [Acinetobacter baumannii]|uniref:DUF6387 family protein n=1 Tax=Acinetobacter baumannii TaxID=470 RepID=UPI001A918E6F|nr:DUF6387 family protein [Acinetobacter baumannii]MBO0660061.1 hypothetical protein [Acinetobacter baumannii]